MKGKCRAFLLAIALVVGFPRLVLGIWTLLNSSNEVSQEPTTLSKGNVVTVNVLTDNGIKTMELEEYLVGVLLREIPGDFHIEAQKAQAVVARTYTLRTTLFKEKHPSNAICTDPGCCQGFRDPAEYLLSGGNRERVLLASQAVSQTSGQVLMYQDMPIDATYFSCSGGQTEDALAVWGVDVPYLQSVASPGEETAEHYWDSVQFTLGEFQNGLGQKLGGSPNNWFGAITYTRGGGVESIVIGGRTYAGMELRELLGLRSTAFSVSVANDIITVTTRGFGHRVGMSQYGAQAMALNEKNYEEILMHYYPGTVIDKEGIMG